MPNNRRIGMGWMTNWNYALSVPTSPWRGSMTIPREMVVVLQENNNYILTQRPIKELELLRIMSKSVVYNDFVMINSQDTKYNFTALYTEMVFIVNEVNNDCEFDIFIYTNNQKTEYSKISYQQSMITFDRSKSGNVELFKNVKLISTAYINTSILKIHLFMDINSIELFVNDGLITMTNTVFPLSPNSSRIEIINRGINPLNIDKLAFYPLREMIRQ